MFAFVVLDFFSSGWKKRLWNDIFCVVRLKSINQRQDLQCEQPILTRNSCGMQREQRPGDNNAGINAIFKHNQT